MASCVCVFGRAGRQWLIWGSEFRVTGTRRAIWNVRNIQLRKEINFIFKNWNNWNISSYGEISCQTKKSKECELLCFTETLFIVNYNLHFCAQHVLEWPFLRVLGINYFLVSFPHHSNSVM